jgi:serine/threonine protein kinase
MDQANIFQGDELSTALNDISLNQFLVLVVLERKSSEGVDALRPAEFWNSEVPIREKIRFARETAEGVAHAHQSNVLICDIHVRNILLDAELHTKLCDFQGRLLSPNGEILISGGASENAESFMPRCNKEFADVKTDIFALGSTIYHIITGHRPFPQYDTIDDETKFEELYRKGHFPPLDGVGGGVVQNCWGGKYESAGEVVNELMVLEQLL